MGAFEIAFVGQHDAEIAVGFCEFGPQIEGAKVELDGRGWAVRLLKADAGSIPDFR